MHKKVLTALTLLSGTLALAQTKIGDCVKMACEHYPQMQEYELIEATEKNDLSNAALGWVPRVSISGKATWQSEVVEMPFDIPGMEFNIPHDQYGITADVTQPIWDGGSSASKKASAVAGAEVKRSQLAVNMYSIRQQIQNTCLAILLTDRQLEQNALLKENLQRGINEVRALITNGMACQSDLDQLEVNLLSCTQQEKQLKADRKSYERVLTLMTGQQMEGVAIVPDEFNPELASNAIGSGQNGRPEMILYEAQSKQVEAQRRQLNSNISPKLNLTLQGGYGRPGMNMLSGEFSPYFVAGVRLQWDLGSLYTLKNDRSKNNSDARKVQISKESFLLNNAVEAEKKLSEIKKAREVLASDDEIVNLRQSIRESGEHQYNQGVLKMNDYLSMLDDEHKARLDRSIHEIQLLMAEYDLYNTLGIN